MSKLEFHFWSEELGGRIQLLDKVTILPGSKAEEILNSQVLSNPVEVKKYMKPEEYYGYSIHSCYKFIRFILNIYTSNNPTTASKDLKKYYKSVFNAIGKKTEIQISKKDFIDKFIYDVNYLNNGIYSDYCSIDLDDHSKIYIEDFGQILDCCYFKGGVREEVSNLGIHTEHYSSFEETPIMKDIISGAYKTRLENEKSS